MPITCNAYVPKTAECVDLASVRREILAAAKRAAKAGRRDQFEVILPVGTYNLTKPFRLSATENPELASLSLSFRATFPGMAKISSLVRMDGKKFVKAEGHDYFTYDFMKEEGKRPLFRDFFLNFRNIPTSTSAVWRNIDAVTPEEKSGKCPREGLWAPIEIAKQVASAPIGGTEIMMYIEWDFAIFHVDSIDFTRTREHEGKTYVLVRLKGDEAATLTQKMGTTLNIGGRETFFRNSPGLLTVDTYAYDPSAGVLYLNPNNPEYTWCHAMEYPACEVLFDFEGVKDVTVEGLSFTGVSSGFACENLYLSGQANCVIGRGRLQTAAILAKDVRNFTVKGCYFKDVDANGVQVVDHSVGVKILDSLFDNVGMCGVTVGNPSWNWQEEKNRTFCARVENCRFRHIAYAYPSAPCIYFGQVDGLKLLHNTVEDCAYSAVSVGWTWSPAEFELGERVNIRGAVLAYNYFRNYMQLLKDGGAIYVLGGNANRNTTPERFNVMHDNFAIVDARKNEYGKYGYYCDGSASNWDVYHSVVLNTEQMPIFSQPHPQALSYHNHFTEIYSNTTPHVSTHVPVRDIVRENYVYDNVSPEEYLAKYPEAKRIHDAAGSNLPI